jgi:hypothetical protein
LVYRHRGPDAACGTRYTRASNKAICFFLYSL